MRILHIIQRYWPAYGGAEIHFHEISVRLVAEGHHITVATTDALDFELFWDPSRRRIGEPEGHRDGVRILRFPVRHLPFPPLAYPAWRRLLWILSALRVVPVGLSQRLSRYTPWVPDLWRWLEQTEEPFDLVAGMTICFEPLLEAGLRFARRRGIPFVIYPLTHLGAGAVPGADALSRFYTMRHQVALVRASDAVVAQTPTERAFYVRHGVPSEKIVVVGPGVNPQEVVGGNGQRFRARYNIRGALVASVSSLSYDKGTFHLIEAIHHLRRQGREVTLALAGTVLQPFRWCWERLSPDEREGVLILGSVGQEEKRDLLAACDIFALPSRTDSFGIVYLEAWLYRKPVVAARTWGVTDVVQDGVDGLIVSFGDVIALAEAIAYLIDRPGLREAMGRKGEQKVHSLHTWDRKYPLIRDLYSRLTGGRRCASYTSSISTLLTGSGV
ncbi:MAG: glycosyltransferase family 4 protein [Anaerolineae bacterium]|nr:glycosyltransferase family 4 protein [Thermoflexus sp.]MDW8064568.1 glycosyltransferase family 4 protein [Anaerolineae bacterium]